MSSATPLILSALLVAAWIVNGHATSQIDYLLPGPISPRKSSNIRP